MGFGYGYKNKKLKDISIIGKKNRKKVKDMLNDDEIFLISDDVRGRKLDGSN